MDERARLHEALRKCRAEKENLISALEQLARGRSQDMRKVAEMRALLRILVDASGKVIFQAGEHVRHTGETLPHEKALAHLEDVALGATELL